MEFDQKSRNARRLKAAYSRYKVDQQNGEPPYQKCGFFRYVKYKKYSDDDMVLSSKVFRPSCVIVDRTRKGNPTIVGAVSSVQRAHSSLYDVLACNKWSFFITLTYDNFDYYVLSSLKSSSLTYTKLYGKVSSLMKNSSFLTDSYFRMRLDKLRRNRYIKKCSDGFILTENGVSHCIDKYDDEKCRRLFSKWRHAVKIQFPDMYYVAVPEYHECGGIHYHLVVGGVTPDQLGFVDSGRVLHKGKAWRYDDFVSKGFSFDYSKGEGLSIYNISAWRDGFSTATEIRSTGAVTKYVSKYLSKNNVDPRFFNKKRYYCSRNILRPELVVDRFDITIISSDRCLDLGAEVNYHNPKRLFTVYDSAEDIIRARLRGDIPVPKHLLPFDCDE